MKHDTIYEAWKDLAEEAISRASQSSDILLEALLWRGFIAEADNGFARLLWPDSPMKDLEDLQNVLPMCCSQAEASFAIIDCRGLRPHLAYSWAGSILEMHGINGSVGWHDPMHLESFKKCQFGAKIEATHLEQPIALFIKTISAAGIWTNWSCGGHGKTAPSIVFQSKYHLDWFLEVQKEIETSKGLLGEWTPSRTSPDREAEFLCNDPRATAFSLQMRARAMFDKSLLQTLRNLRNDYIRRCQQKEAGEPPITQAPAPDPAYQYTDTGGPANGVNSLRTWMNPHLRPHVMECPHFLMNISQHDMSQFLPQRIGDLLKNSLVYPGGGTYDWGPIDKTMGLTYSYVYLDNGPNPDSLKTILHRLCANDTGQFWPSPPSITRCVGLHEFDARDVLSVGVPQLQKPYRHRAENRAFWAIYEMMNGARISLLYFIRDAQTTIGELYLHHRQTPKLFLLKLSMTPLFDDQYEVLIKEHGLSWPEFLIRENGGETFCKHGRYEELDPDNQIWRRPLLVTACQSSGTAEV